MQTFLSGPNNKPLLVFLHGWPDTAALWDAQVAHFESRYRCLRVTLPNFGDEHTKPGSYDFPELVRRLVTMIEAHRAPNERALIVGHDWGAYLTYLIQQARPDLVRAIVTMDVGAHMKSSSLRHAAFLISYQWWLIIAYFIAKLLQPVGNWMTRLFSVYARAPRGRHVWARSNYLYFYIWRGLMMKRYRHSILTRYKPNIPILYLYGTRKPYMFHSEQWLRTVESLPHSQVVAMELSGHWVMVDEPLRTNQIMDEWLSKSL